MLFYKPLNTAVALIFERMIIGKARFSEIFLMQLVQKIKGILWWWMDGALRIKFRNKPIEGLQSQNFRRIRRLRAKCLCCNHSFFWLIFMYVIIESGLHAFRKVIFLLKPFPIAIGACHRVRLWWRLCRQFYWQTCPCEALCCCSHQ